MKVFAVMVFASLLTACGGGETYDGSASPAEPTGLNTGSSDTPTDSTTDSSNSTGSASAFLENSGNTVQGTSSVTLGWDAPVARADGVTPLSLSEIDGYIIYYGTTSHQYNMSVDVTDGTAALHTITGLAKGTYYFTVIAYDIHGFQSDDSIEVVAHIQ